MTSPDRPMTAWTGTHVRLENIGSAMAVCTLDGELAGATPSARSLLARLGIDTSRVPVALPATLWAQLVVTPVGEATQWRPPGARDECLGCTRYHLGESHVLLLMREVSDKQLELSQRLQRQRLEATGRLVASVAHDLRAPLASIVFNADVLTRQATTLDPTVMRSILGEITVAAQRLRQATDGLLDFARLGPPVSSPVGTSEIVERVRGLVRSTLREGGHELDVKIEEAEWVRGNRLVIEQIIVNLVLNALEAADGARRVRLAFTRPSGRSDRVEVSIEDDGPGVPPELRDRIFDPFFTTKPRGSGLGLTTAREAARELGGDLVLSPSERGARFVLTLVAANAAPS